MSSAPAYQVADEIFALYPGYVRGVVLAFDVSNGVAPDDLVALLRAAEADLRRRLSLANLTEEPRIRAWREAFRAFGAKPSEFRSSIEAMARRALRDDPLPAINALVDVGNVVSLQHLVPAGAHAIDHLTGNLALRLASGTETFIPLGSTTVEHPEPGEVIFAEGQVVLTRRWVWRQGTHTLAQPETRAVEFNVDGLPPVTPAEVERISGAIAELVQRFCGGRVRLEMLTREQPRILIGE